MLCNVGTSDRTARFILGVIILAVGYSNQSWWGLLGFVPLLTGTLRFCPAYTLIGFNSNKG
jgi:hypothetical protein